MNAKDVKMTLEQNECKTCKLKEMYMDALNEIAENHSSGEEEIDGTMCFKVDCDCSFCEQWKEMRGDFL